MRNHQSYRIILLPVLSVVLIFAFGSASQGMKIEGEKYKIDLREEGAFFDRAATDYYVEIESFNNMPSGDMTIAFWIYTPFTTIQTRTPVSYAVKGQDNEFTLCSSAARMFMPESISMEKDGPPIIV